MRMIIALIALSLILAGCSQSAQSEEAQPSGSETGQAEQGALEPESEFGSDDLANLETALEELALLEEELEYSDVEIDIGLE
jgi:PBP1b-binding outer membrane lipoprotein LpoB